MIDNKEKILPFFAMIILIIGIGASLYVHAQQSMIEDNQEFIIINGEMIHITQLFETISLKTIETDDGEKTGLPINEVINKSSITCPSCYKYTFIASDGYQQTVEWHHITKGVFTNENHVFFPNLAHAFWVKDIIEIKVE